jgi:hypothetical protein
MTMALGASAGPAAQERIPLLQRQGQTDPRSVTLTGCVANGSTAGIYTLTTSGPKADAQDKNAMKAITLTLTGEVDLSRHVGHEVSITGVHAIPWVTVMPNGPEGAVTHGDRKPTASFAVTSLTMIAASCSQPAD